MNDGETAAGKDGRVEALDIEACTMGHGLQWQDVVLVCEKGVCAALGFLTDPAEVCVAYYTLCCLGIDERVVEETEEKFLAEELAR